MKRLFCVLAAALFLFTMSAPGFAQPPGAPAPYGYHHHAPHHVKHHKKYYKKRHKRHIKRHHRHYPHPRVY